MNKRTILAGAMTVIASATVMADQVPDKLIIEGRYPVEAQIGAISSIQLDAQRGQLTIFSNEGTNRTPLVLLESKGHFTWRDSRKLVSPIFNAEKSNVFDANNIHLEWNEIEGASAYEIVGTYDDDSGDRFSSTYSAGYPALDFKDLKYGRNIYFKIRAISPLGEEFNSDWNFYTSAVSPAWRSFYLRTDERYDVPTVATVSDPGTTSFRVNLHLDGDNAYAENFQIGADGNFVADKLKVIDLTQATAPAGAPRREGASNPWSDYTITDADRAAGYIDVTGLNEGTYYSVALYNSSVEADVDAVYNTTCVWTGTSQPVPVLIPHQIDQTLPGAADYEACSIDSILNAYTRDNQQPEGTAFRLEGGKAYCIGKNVTLSKGLILETRPEDLAAGKRAIVYLGGMSYESSTTISANFILGSEIGFGDVKNIIGDITLRDIDFDCPLAHNFGHQDEGEGTSTGNYVFNTYSTSQDLDIKSLTVQNCTFKRMIRGFLRVQSNNVKQIHKLTVDNCLFSDCGYYDKNGRGYAWFAGDGANPKSNIFEDLTFSNNTIYDSPRTAFVTDNDKNLAYPESVKWNIKIYNNTFFNFSTRTTGRNFFQTRYVPAGSHFGFERNLIVQAAADNDNRPLYLGGADIRETDRAFTYTIKDNYSVASRAANQGNDKVFNAQAFTSSKNSFGKYPDYRLNCETSDLVVKQLKNTDGSIITPDALFNNPNPPYTSYDADKPNHLDHVAPAEIMEALKYKTIPAIITEKNIGDPRWR